MTELSDLVKVILHLGDISDSNAGPVDRAQAITVQSYRFTMSRNVDTNTVAQGPGTADVFSITLRVGTRDNLKRLYQCLIDTFPHTFSLIFNAKFDQSNHLREYDNALTVDGYVISIDENFQRPGAENEGRYMSLEMKIRVRKMTCAGENNNLDYSF